MVGMPKIEDVEDATKLIIRFLQEKLNQNPNPISRITEKSHYGYDLYIPSLIDHFFPLPPLNPFSPQSPDYRANYSPIFYDAAWLLCLKSILRPSVTHYGAQCMQDESGFSLTSTGKEKLMGNANNI